MDRGSGIDLHGSEFQTDERLAKKAYALLPKQHRAFGYNLDYQRYQHRHGHQQRQAYYDKCDIQDALPSRHHDHWRRRASHRFWPAYLDGRRTVLHVHCGIHLPRKNYAFQTWSALVLIPLTALRVSTIHGDHATSSWKLITACAVQITTTSKDPMVAWFQATDACPSHFPCSRVGPITGMSGS